MKNSVLLLFLLAFSKAYSQDTLTLKITNMQNIYPPCYNHWTPCAETILFGELTSNLSSNKVYTIHVVSTDILNRLSKNSSSIYRVVLRKRYSRGPFEPAGDEQYSLMDIRNPF